MALINERKTHGNLVRVYVSDEDDPKDRWLAYEINKSSKTVRFFPRDETYPLKEILFEGFDKLPPILHENGYLRGGVSYAFAQKLSEKNVRKLRVVPDGNPSMRKQGNGDTMVVPYSDLDGLIERFKGISAQATLDRKIAASETFSALFPTKYMCSKLPLVDPEKITVPTIVMRGEYDGIAGMGDLLKFFDKLANTDKQFTMMQGISHASFQQKNYMLVYHILSSFFSQPTPVYRGD